MICCNQIKKNDRVHLFEVNIVFEKNRKLSKGSKKYLKIPGNLVNFELCVHGFNINVTHQMFFPNS